MNSKARNVYTIYHNPRCSKSRAALALLEERGIEPVVIEYLKTPPSAADLESILRKLGMRPAELLRKGEDGYKQHVAGRNPNDAKIIALMVEHPVLIERPIVVHGERAVLGRPPESILQLLK